MFPTHETLKRKWIKLIRRENRLPEFDAQVCSCHFVDGDMRKLPTLFPWNKEKYFQFKSPEKRKRTIKDVANYTAISLNNRVSDHDTVLQASNMLEASVSVDMLYTEVSRDPVINMNIGEANVHPPIEILNSSETHGSVTASVYESGKSELKSLYLQNKSDKKLIVNAQDQGSQTEYKFPPPVYKSQIYFLGKKIRELESENQKLQKQSFSFFSVKDNNSLCLHYTGLTTSMFTLILELISGVSFTYYYDKKHVICLSLEDQLFLTLVKLRRNLSHSDLSVRFDLSTGTITIIFNTIIHVLHEILFKNFMNEIPSQNKNNLCILACFSSFPNCRIILDCTEIQCDVPNNMYQQKLTYSSYKSRNTGKILIGCAPNGSCTFCSKIYPGSFSDQVITQDSGVLKQLKPGDLVVADKGFLLTNILPQGVSLNIPPIKHNPKFTVSEIQETKRIARARIHVERIINRLKRFKILDRIHQQLYHMSDKIVQVCAALTNFQSSILHEMDRFYTVGESELCT